VYERARPSCLEERSDSAHDMIETKKVGLDSETLKDLSNLHSAMMSTAKTLESAIVKQGMYLQITRQIVSIILCGQSVVSRLLFIASFLLAVTLSYYLPVAL